MSSQNLATTKKVQKVCSATEIVEFAGLEGLEKDSMIWPTRSFVCSPEKICSYSRMLRKFNHKLQFETKKRKTKKWKTKSERERERKSKTQIRYFAKGEFRQHRS